MPFAACLGLMALVVIFLPELVGWAWHMVYGDAASYRGWTVPVPGGWFATRQGESLTLARMLRFPLRQVTPTIVFLPMHVDSDFAFDPRTWQNAQVSIQNQRGYRLAATRLLVMAGEPAYCWEFVRRGDNSQWWITCLMPAERLSADFSGQHDFAGALYAILPLIVRKAAAT